MRFRVDLGHRRRLFGEIVTLYDVLAFLVFFAFFEGKDVCPANLYFALFTADGPYFMSACHHLRFLFGAVAQIIGPIEVMQQEYLRIK